ncbi:tetratricopeptide repeat protein [Aliarcobacter butzleri]
MHQGKTFRLFTSSTFSDFSVERRLLQEYVFPEIKKYCNESNLNFQPIDLRWGVSNEAQLDQKTLQLCIEEVRASKINPHPNFLIMAGDRYGWIPLPYLIEKSEYEAIVTNIEKEEDKELLNIWYKLDENQIPASYILCERKNEFVEYLNWEKVENQLRDILQSSVNKTSLSKNDKEKYFMSATEHEVIEGIFKYLNTTPFQESILQQNKTLLQIDSENVYAYIRNIKSIDESYKNNFIDKDLKNVNKFKKCIKESIDNNNILEVDIELENISKDNMNGSLLYSYETIKNDQKSIFVEIMINNLKKSINLYKNSIKKFSEDELEVFEQKSFKELKMKNFLGREESLQTIDKYINDNNNEALVVYGKSGLGKSSLMAKAIDNAQNIYLNKKIVYKFVGSTVNLTTTSEILISILKELGITEEIRKIKNSKNLQEENEKIEEFYYRVYDHLKLIKEDTIIFIDAIDQLINEDEFLWLPKKLPNNLKIVISALKDDNYKEDSKYLEDITKVTKNTYELQAFDLNNAKELVINLLEKYNRKISQEQMNYVLDIYKNIKSPLYLVVAIQDLKDWKSTDKNQKLAKNQKDEIKSFIDNLSTIHHHNQEFVKRVFAYISLIDGLSEIELIELLSSDNEFLNKIAPETFHTNTTKELPIVIWSRLHTQIKEFLKLENVDNQNVMKFFHREFDNISELTQDEHEHLIELLQNLMFKYQDEDFYSNRWGILYIIAMNKYYLIYEINYLENEKSKLFQYSKKLFDKVENNKYLKELFEIFIIQGDRIREKNKSILISYYLKSYYYISKFLFEKNPTLWDNYYAIGLNNYADYLRKIGKSTESIKLFKKSLEISETIYNNKEYSMGNVITLNNLAVAFKEMQEINEAIFLINKALNIIEPLFNNNPSIWALDYALSLNNLSECYYLNNKIDTAITTQQTSLEIIEVLFNSDFDMFAEDYTLCLSNLAKYLYYGQRNSEAIYLQEKSVEITKSLFKKNENKWGLDYAISLSNLSSFIRYEDIKAFNFQEEAINIIEFLYKNDPDQYIEHYIRAINQLGAIYFSIGAYNICINIFKDIERLLNPYYQADPKRWSEEYVRNSVNLASSFNKEGKINEEIKNLKKALKALESLYKEPSKKWIQHHEIILRSLYSALLKTKRKDEALKYKKKFIKISKLNGRL